MDPRLAEIYGTNADTEQTQDTEKVAAAQLAEKLAGEDSLNLENMSGEDLEALAQEVLAADGATEATEEKNEESDESEESEETTDKEASEKLAEADYLGRVMAHSYVQELKNIEKSAASYGGMYGEGKKSGKKKLKDMASKAKGAVSEGMDRAKAVGAITAAKASNLAAKHPGKAKALAGLGAAGAGALAAKKMMSKKSSALDTLAAQRALEILEANGIDPDAVDEQEEKTASNPADVLAAAVEARAVELLKERGFEFESEEASEE